jgi:hypothetical protein
LKSLFHSGKFYCMRVECHLTQFLKFSHDSSLCAFRVRCPTTVKVTKMSGLGSQQWSEPELYEFPLPGDIKALKTEDDNATVPGFNFCNSQGLKYEAEEVNHCFREGLTESPSFTTAQCIEIMRLITEIGNYA